MQEYDEQNNKIEQPEAVYMKLPEETFDPSREDREGENFQISFKNNTGYLWLYHPTKPGVLEYDFEADLPGFLPVACCAAEWDLENKKPYYIQRRMVEISSVQRRNGIFRAIIKITSDEIRYFAVGCVFPL